MADVARVRTVLTGWTGGPGLSTTYWWQVAGFGAPEATEMVARVRAFWDAIKGNLATVVKADVSGNIDLIDVATGALTGTLSTTPGAQVVGTGFGGLNEPQSALNMQGNTGYVLNGRRLVSRTYVSPLDSGVVTNQGVASTTALTAMAAGGTALLTQIATAVDPAAWHRPVNGAGGQAVVITNYSTPAKIATLRSRRD